MKVSLLLSTKKNSSFKSFVRNFKKLSDKYSLTYTDDGKAENLAKKKFDITVYEIDSRFSPSDAEYLKGNIATFFLAKRGFKKELNFSQAILIYQDTPFEYFDNLIDLALNPIPTDISAEVLVIGSSSNDKNLIKGLLSRIGYSGKFIEKLELSASKFPDTPFSCLILDFDKVNKAEEDGILKLSAIHDFSKIPIIILYNELEIDTAHRLLSTGVTDFIKKPYEPQDFILRILSRSASKEALEGFEKRINTEENLNRKLLELNEELKSVNELNRQLTKALEQQALTDELTGVNNRRQILHFIKRGINHAYDYDMSLAVIIVDIDFFKKVNDTHGHDFGDKVIRETALMISSSLEGEYYLGRIGGEEFVVVLYKSSKEDVIRCAKKINKTVKHHKFKSISKNIEIGITVSLGVTLLRKKDNEKDIDALIKRADEGLYLAKNKGRDTFVFVP